MSRMHFAAVQSAANGTRGAHAIAKVAGISVRQARRIARQLGVTVGNGNT